MKSSKSSRTAVVRSGEDLLALLPVLFGFQPVDSLVLVCVPPGPSMHARVDLGRTRQERAGALGELLFQAHRHGAARVLLCVLTDLADADRWGREVLDVLAGSPVEVLEVIAGDGRRWRPLGSDSAPRPYDVWSHPIVAEAVLDGRVVLPDRETLARTLDPRPEEVARVAGLLARGPSHAAAGWSGWVAQHLDRGTSPGAEEVAALLRVLREGAGPAAVCALMSRDDAARHRDLWSAVLRAAPPGWAAAPAALLGVAAWQAGDGALAWCAVDRARESGEGSDLLTWLVSVLEEAVHPDDWDGRVPAGPEAPAGSGS